VRIAIVGAGWIAVDHRAALRQLGHEVVAVCDVDRAKAEALAEPIGAAVYAELGALLDGEDLDAVVVATPPMAHREGATAVLERGLPLYLEKPIARTLDDARAIVETAARTGLPCAIGYQWHALELLDDVARLVEGQRLALLSGRSIGPTKSRPWFLDRAQGGGNVLERASHQIDLQRAVAGEVSAVQATASGVLLAQGEGEQGDIEDAAALVLHFAAGAVGTISIAWTREGTPGYYSLDVVAEETTLALQLDPDFRLSGTSRGEPVATRAAQHPFERSLARFLEAVRTGDTSRVFCTPADAAGTLAVAEACRRALETGEVVSVAVSS
jgi:myo-inositol 2-dehydrogenase / D-chiro-inositol 1-dehydrogenase